uniref:Putative terminase n=1 Tax=viral metagenome TaxID=1070528 RepID=A0A6H1ZR48_9ZZZZ
MKRYDNKKSLTFENQDEEGKYNNPGLKSSIRVFTANKKGGGRSQTINNLHCSEVAFWEGDVYALMIGLKQAVPKEPNTMIILESTANGTSGYFHDEYWKAKKGKSDYTAVFLPWYIHEEYEMEGEIEEMDDLEEALYHIHLSEYPHEQRIRKLVWRRDTIRNECNGDVKEFMQEYPTTDKEAFQKKEGRVYYAFDRDRHVIPHYEPSNDDNVFFGGYDFGAEHPCAYGLFAIDKYGTIYKFREFKRIGTTFEQQAKEFKEMEVNRDTGVRYNILRRYRGHDSGAKQAELELKRLGIKLTEGIVKRELGITTINGLFINNKYFISDECVNTIYELENHVYKNKYESETEDGILKLKGDEHKDADVVKELDDCVDGDRYGITTFMHKRPKEKKETVERIKEKIHKDTLHAKKKTKMNW